MNDHTAPIILDLGKKKKRALRDMKRGRGRLVDEIDDSINEVRRGLGDEVEGKLIVPIVLVYRKKNKKRKGFGW